MQGLAWKPCLEAVRKESPSVRPSAPESLVGLGAICRRGSAVCAAGTWCPHPRGTLACGLTVISHFAFLL